MRFGACLNMFNNGMLHTLKNARVVSLDRHPQCDGEVPLCYQKELHTQGISVSPQDSNLVSVEGMQLVLLYLSVSDDRSH
jgi:hypothetical protein